MSSNKPANGRALAALLAAAIGCFSFGVLVDVAEAFPVVSRRLNLYTPTGDLSGKSTLAVVVWLIAWAILHARWKNRSLAARPMAVITLLLLFLAILATFPPFFGLF